MWHSNNSATICFGLVIRLWWGPNAAKLRPYTGRRGAGMADAAQVCDVIDLGDVMPFARGAYGVGLALRVSVLLYARCRPEIAFTCQARTCPCDWLKSNQSVKRNPGFLLAWRRDIMRRASRLQAKRHARLAFGFVLAAVAALPSLPTCHFSAISLLTPSPADRTRTACHPSPSLRTLASWFAAEGHCATVSSALALWQAGTAYIPTRQSRSDVLEEVIYGLDERGSSIKRANLVATCCNVVRPSRHPMRVAWYPCSCLHPTLPPSKLSSLSSLLMPSI